MPLSTNGGFTPAPVIPSSTTAGPVQLGNPVSFSVGINRLQVAATLN
jgi:hypothetical protein